MAIHHRYCGLLRASAEVLRACYPTARVGVLCAVGLASAVFAGCGELEPLREPEVVDLELTADALQAAARDAQRMVAELRADLEVRRKELAEAQIARAQLEGRVRETERRIIEARHVIELQREELAAARTEQAHVFQGGFQLQGRMKELQKPPSRMRNSGPAPELEPQGISPEHVPVKSGDTLWNISQRYHVNVERLRTLNQLTDNKIVIGRTLRLSDDRPTLESGADQGTSTQ
ncbi:MAG: LysM peptidoglycan-binding domain-containing protein [Nitrospirota bacterium]